jgi:hypothetical protein
MDSRTEHLPAIGALNCAQIAIKPSAGSVISTTSFKASGNAGRSGQRNSIQVPVHGRIHVREVCGVFARYEFTTRDRLGSRDNARLSQRLDTSRRKFGQGLSGPNRNCQTSPGTCSRRRFDRYHEKSSGRGPGRNTKIGTDDPRSPPIDRNRHRPKSRALRDRDDGHHPPAPG